MSTGEPDPLPADHVLPGSPLRRLIASISSHVVSELAVTIGFAGTGKSSLLRYVENASAGALMTALGRPLEFPPAKLVRVRIECRHIDPQDPISGIATVVRSKVARQQATPTAAEGAGGPLYELLSIFQDHESARQRLVLLVDDFDKIFSKIQPDAYRLFRPRDGVAWVLAAEAPLVHAALPVSAPPSPFVQATNEIWLRGLSPTRAAALVALLAQPRAERPSTDAPALSAGPSSPAIADGIGQDAHFLMEHLVRYPKVLRVAAQVLRDERARGRLAPSQHLDNAAREHLLVKVCWQLRDILEYYWSQLAESERQALLAPYDQNQRGAVIQLEERGLLDVQNGTPKLRFLLDQFIKSRRHDRSPDLPRVERKLFDLLRSSPGVTWSMDDLFHAAWGDDGAAADKSRRVQIAVSRLRSRLMDGAFGDVVSVRGRGYRFEPRDGQSSR